MLNWMLRRRFALVLTALALLLLGLVAVAYAATAPQESVPTEQPSQLPSARRGRAVYQEHCAECHGNNGLGEGPAVSGLDFPPTQFADVAVARQATLAQWFHVAKNGRMERMMPPWGAQLGDQEIWDAVAYAWSLHLDAGELDEGREIYQANCTRCHGEAGQGDGPEAPTNTADFTAPELLDRSLADWFDVVTAGRGAMPSFADRLTEDQRWAVLEYVRSFAYSSLQPPTYQPGNGVVRGTVENATPSGEAPTGITVTLRVFDSETFDEVQRFESVTGDDGSFQFDGLSTSPGWSYVATLDYAGVPYASNAGSFSAEVTELDLPITVYESTEDGSGIRIERAHWFVDFDGQSLLIGEMYIIGQDGDRAYIGGEEVAPGRRETLRFPLPPGYEELRVEPGPLGQRFFVVEDAVVDTLPVPPGQGIRQLMLSYRLPYTTKRFDLQHPVAYPTTYLNILVSDIGVEVSSPQVSFRDKQGASGQQFLNFVGENLAAGEMITLSFDRLPLGETPSAAVGSSLTLPAVAGAVTLVIVVLGLAIYIRRRQGAAPIAVPEASVDLSELEVERQRLVLAIARLDDEFEAGNIDEDLYRQERARRKAQLLEIVQQIEGQSDS